MTPLDASRLLIAVAGSVFAKDSLEILRRFAKLKPLGDKGPKTTLEDFLARRIEALPEESSFTDGDRRELRRPFGSRRLSKIAFELMWAAGVHSNDLPRTTFSDHVSHKRLYAKRQASTEATLWAIQLNPGPIQLNLNHPGRLVDASMRSALVNRRRPCRYEIRASASEAPSPRLFHGRCAAHTRAH
jgi:hypothetical protein